MVVQWISVISLLIFLVYILFAFLIGIKRGFIKSAIRLVTIVASMIISFVVLKIIRSKGIFNFLEKQLGKILVNIFKNTSNLDLNSINTENFSKTIIALVSPLMFLLLFMMVNFILYIIYKILSSAVERSAKNGENVVLSERGRVIWSGPSKAGGMIISVACSILVFGMYLIPLNGYVGFVANAKNYVYGTSDYEYVSKISEQAFELREKFLFKFTANLSDDFFDSETELIYRTEGAAYATNVKRETYGILSLFDSYKDAFKSFREISDLQGLREILPVYNKKPAKGTSNVLAQIVATEFLTAYNFKNSSFYVDNVDTKYQDVIGVYLDEIKTSNEKNVIKNVTSALDVIESLINLKDYFVQVKNADATTDSIIFACQYINEDNIKDVEKIAKLVIEDYFTGNSIDTYYTVVECALNTMLNSKKTSSYQTEARAVNNLIRASYICLKNPDSYDTNMPFVDDMLNDLIVTTYLADEIASLKQNGTTILVSEENYLGVKYTIEEKLQDSTLTQEQVDILNNFKDLFKIES